MAVLKVQYLLLLTFIRVESREYSKISVKIYTSTIHRLNFYRRQTKYMLVPLIPGSLTIKVSYYILFLLI